jgi:hypothetical protein
MNTKQPAIFTMAEPKVLARHELPDSDLIFLTKFFFVFMASGFLRIKVMPAESHRETALSDGHAVNLQYVQVSNPGTGMIGLNNNQKTRKRRKGPFFAKKRKGSCRICEIMF